jgi:hypothetical protein
MPATSGGITGKASCASHRQARLVCKLSSNFQRIVAISVTTIFQCLTVIFLV